ncbi:helix-turn-helix domain-containing protein [Nocardia nova]|uniref:helix-turn-helix domain-containing protein n=1 Tax=Nocardia nova TaxID=37330 RepID=UPI00340DDB56
MSFFDTDRESALLRAAEPVVSATMRQLGTAEFAMMVTDRDARIAGRWVSGRTMQSLLDRMGVLPGALFEEASVGSTGLGTVLEDRSTAIVDGAEHYNRLFDPVIAVGTPVVHPGTGCVEGVLDLVCPTGAPPEIMVALIERAAREIGDRLVSGYAAEDRVLLDAFLRNDRRGPKRPVVAVNARLIMANHLAEPLIGSSSAAALWERVRTTLSTGRSVMRVAAGDTDALDVEVRAIQDADNTVGALLQVPAAKTTTRPRTVQRDAAAALVVALIEELPGHSYAWRTAVGAAARAALTRGHILLHGPVGVGKSALARALAHTAPDRASAQSPTIAPRHERQNEQRVIDDLHTWSDSRLAALRRRLHDQDPGLVIATATTQWIGDLSDELTAMFEHIVEVPDLSRRPEDIADIAMTLIARQSDEVKITSEALRDLTRRQWPGNVTQLERTLNTALAQTPVTRLRSADLPEVLDAPRPHRQLTYLEAVERDAIAAVVSAAHGNKSKAAQVLGISRATLYRKLVALGLD